MLDLEIISIRPREASDLPAASAVPTLTRISERHHALARALASGISEGEAAAMCGYSLSRVSILKGTPAFRDLLDLYAGQVANEFAEVTARMVGLTKDALTELQDRLEDAPEKIATKDLIELLKVAADRAGYAPTQKQELNLNVNLAERIEAARQRVLRDITPPEAT